MNPKGLRDKDCMVVQFKAGQGYLSEAQGFLPLMKLFINVNKLYEEIKPGG